MQYIQDKGLNKPVIKESESDDVVQLKKRIAELEFENRYMKNEIQSLQRRCGIPIEPINIPKMPEAPEATPMIPDTPIPMVPLAFRNITNTPPVIAPINPPPNNSRRQKTGDLLSGVELNGPEVGKKLENLNLDKMDDVFDNDFDPRSAEKKDTFGLEPFGPTPSLAEGAIKNHADELKEMLGECDQRIQQVAGFNHASFEFGDLGALGQEEEYVTPSITYEK
uniref:PID domain-containing protein n=1 Tax=Panagrolaimus sp. JU765 TaxID=591449 RepID=A0AC34Q4Z4_9BILA